MTPDLYLYKETEKGYEYYVNEYTTQMGLSLFDANTEIRITEFGATQYKKHGWATEKEIPSLNTVGEAISFIASEEDIGLIDFAAELIGFGTLSTHDDGECHFVMNSKQQCLWLMKETILPVNRDKLTISYLKIQINTSLPLALVSLFSIEHLKSI